MAWLLMTVHEHIMRSYHPQHKLARLAALNALLDLLGQRAREPATWRYATHILLGLVLVPELQEVVGEMLSQLIVLMLNPNQGVVGEQDLMVVGDLLPRMMSTLVGALEANITKKQQHPGGPTALGDEGSHGGRQCLVRIIRQLSVEAPARLHNYLRHVGPLPSVPGLEGACELQQQILSMVKLTDVLSEFVDRAAAMPLTSRQKALQDIKTALIRTPCEVYEATGGSTPPLGSRDKGSAGEGCQLSFPNCQLHPKALEAAWKLVPLSQELDDPDMSELAAQLLVGAGPLDPTILSFTPPGSRVPLMRAGQSSVSTPSTGTKNASKARASGSTPSTSITSHHQWPGVQSSLDALLPQILLILAENLMDSDVSITRLAQSSLRDLLATEDGKAALQGLGNGPDGTARQSNTDIRAAYLSVFMGAPPPGEPKGHLDPSKSPGQLLGEVPWGSISTDYDGWVCSLVYVLLGFSGQTTVKLMHRLVRKHPVIAEALLPHLLLDIGTQRDKGSGELMGQLSARISRHVLSPSDPRRAVRTILGALEVLRSAHRDASVSGKTAASDEGWVSPLSWSHVYCLHLDYLEVAQAALRCASHYSALLYLEHWCVQEFGNIRMQPLAVPELESLMGLSSPGQPDLADHKVPAASHRGAIYLLSQILGETNEPDGVYAAASLQPSGSFYSDLQLRLLQREGAWKDLLLGYDLRLQGSPGNPMEAQGLVRALQGLGCTQLAYSYTSHMTALGSRQHGLPSAASMQELGYRGLPGGLADSSKLPDVWYELAWQLKDWGKGGRDNPEAKADIAPTEVLDIAGTMRGIHGSSRKGFHEHVYELLEALAAGDHDRFSTTLSATTHQCVCELATISTESVTSVNPLLVLLQMVGCLRQAGELVWPYLRMPGEGAVLSGFGITESALRSSRGQWSCLDYDLNHSLLMLQCSILGLLAREEELCHLLLDNTIRARRAGRYQHAEGHLSQLKRVICNKDGGKGGEDDEWRNSWLAADSAWHVEVAKVRWQSGQQQVAAKMMRSMAEQLKNDKSSKRDPLHKGQIFSLAGQWGSEAQFETPTTADVMSLMGTAAEMVVENTPQEVRMSVQHAPTCCKILYRLAHYADGRYKDILAQKRSPEWRTQQLVIQQKKQQLEDLKKMSRSGTTMTDKQMAYLAYQIKKLQRPIDADEGVQKVMNSNEQKFLHIALKNYQRCLVAGDRYDLEVVFRITQLWFDRMEDPAVNQQLEETFKSVPSYKFVPLVYQVASRVSNHQDTGGFQKVVRLALARLARDHPYHTLYQIFALRNGNLGPDGKPTRGNDQFGVMSHNTDLDKVAAAEQFLSNLVADGQGLKGSRNASGRQKGVSKEPVATASGGGILDKELLDQMSSLVNAYVELAALPAPAGHVDSLPDQPFPAQIRRRVKDLKRIPVVSSSLEVDPSCTYQEIPYVVTFGERISFVGGVNKPKLIKCLDSHGCEHRQLVKSGNDDLRQDAVMQQFFGLVNRLLGSHRETEKRRLKIVTYKVVPFSPTAGLVEWVGNTLPLGEYLLGKTRQGGAHGRYKRPGEWSFWTCLKAMQDAGAQPQQQRAAFDKVCHHFSPVLHHFFLEMYRDIPTWFDRRTAYTRSVAVNSMAGYIIGLGDRHSGNILLDKSTAECVHIDLGIAFEQGRFLNTPELVPFRLTRDVVDGMGVTAVEGSLRRCGEETMKVLRQSRDLLLTVMEVVIHDPLYRWAMTPIKAQQRQKDVFADAPNPDEETVEGPHGAGAVEGPHSLGNVDAERAVLRIKQKLEGVEGTEGEPWSVEGQVQHLLMEAQDPDNLSRMYVGWAPWM